MHLLSRPAPPLVMRQWQWPRPRKDVGIHSCGYAPPQGHDEIVWAVEVAGNRLLSASADKTIRMWDIESRRCEQVLEDHARPVLSLAVAGNKLFSGSYDYTIKVWSLDTLQRLKTLTGRHSTPYPVLFWSQSERGLLLSTVAAVLQTVDHALHNSLSLYESHCVICAV